MLALIKEFRDVLKWHELLWQMVGREVKTRYKQSVLGYFWVLLNPTAQMLVMSFAFSIIMRIPTNAAGNVPYSIFLFVALLPWNLFANSLSSASASLVSSSSLITKVYFPRSILVIATILAKIVDFLFANIVLIIYMIAYRMPININILWVIPIFFIQQIFTTGLALFFAASNLIYRDIQYLLSLGLLLWMYLTPVIYPASLTGIYSWFLAMNPMTGVIKAARSALFADFPMNWLQLGISGLACLFILLIGLYYFQKTEKYFADIV